MAESTPVFPVAHWTFGALPEVGCAMLKLAFLTNSMQPLEKATPSPCYLLTPEQLRLLQEQIQSALAVLKTDVSAMPPGLAH